MNGDPVSKENIYPKINIGFSNKIVYLILLIFVLLVIYYIKYFFSKRKKKKEKFRLQIQKILKPYNKTEAIEIRANSTFLFGIFRIYDRNKKDISYLFSPKIRQLFLLLLFSSNQKGAYGLTSGIDNPYAPLVNQDICLQAITLVFRISISRKISSLFS